MSCAQRFHELAAARGRFVYIYSHTRVLSSEHRGYVTKEIKKGYYFLVFLSLVPAHTQNPKKVTSQELIFRAFALGPCSYWRWKSIILVFALGPHSYQQLISVRELCTRFHELAAARGRFVYIYSHTRELSTEHRGVCLEIKINKKEMGITFLFFFHRSLLILKILKKSLARTRLFPKVLLVPGNI